jgi:hypothetical protein
MTSFKLRAASCKQWNPPVLSMNLRNGDNPKAGYRGATPDGESEGCPLKSPQLRSGANKSFP